MQRPQVEFLENIVNTGNEYLWSFPKTLPWLVAILLAAGFYVTVRLAVIQVRQLRHAVRVVAGKYDDPDDPGDVSHFQALSTALSATVGIGNIAGVATAIHYGGPGALFWMWVTAFFGMGLKFAECTLAVHYREFDAKGEASGGPMYYIEKGLGKSWKPLAVMFAFFAIISSFGGGNMNQANTVAVSATSEFGVAAYIVGIVLALVVGVVIVGGIRSIAKVASYLAPSMALLYVMAALVILAMNVGDVPGAFGTIFSEAFNPTATVSGSVAGVWSMTLLWGVKRGLFSNEAGQGSAPIAHAAAKTKEPVREGVVAMLGPLIDTLIICTMTGLVIVISGVWDQKKSSEVPLSKASLVVGENQTMAAQVPIVNGVLPAGLSYTFSDGVVDNAKLTSDEKPWSGKLVYNETDATYEAFDKMGVEADPVLSGDMLQNSSALTAWAFEEGMSPIGDWGGLVVTLCVFLFAVSTMISWSYYGDRCVTYLFGSKYVFVYRLVYVSFVYLGATMALEVVWAYGDLALGLMTLPNLIAVVLLMPKLLKLSRDYFKRLKNDELPVPRSDNKVVDE